ncbi:MAG TPA: hypothetical protein VM531_09030 [Sphingomicrobium sp.]|jgi:hypothetical protein|nr:hypothetical protein [Sphingomicrobium sp.]
METQLAAPPRPGQEWLRAVESQIDAKRIIKMLRASPQESIRRLSGAWTLDDLVITNARPFYWTRESIDAVFAIADKIPTDAQLNSWNLETNAVWWHFEAPLPLKTTTSDVPIQAFSAAWVDGKNQFLDEGPTPRSSKVFVCICWTSDPFKDNPSIRSYMVCPSQVWCWHHGETIDEMMARIAREHALQYGPGGRFAGETIVGEKQFKHVSLVISKFVLAALMWLTSKAPVLTTEDGHVERHRRKEFDRVLEPKEKLDYVKVIRLRRQERHLSVNPDAGHREYGFRFIVDGHVRNQPVGPGHKDRKLIWISPYVKGPDDKPLRVPQHKVYLVNR